MEEGKVQVVTTVEDYEKVKGTDKYFFVKFVASWCGHCKAIAPLYSDLAEKYKDKAVFIEVDVENLGEKLEDAKPLAGVPTFKIFKSGKKLLEYSSGDPETLKNVVNQVIVTNSFQSQPGEIKKITEDLAFGSQPSKEQLEAIKDFGIESVVNMRLDNEKGYLPDTEAILKKADVAYKHIPLDDIKFTKEYCDEFNATLDSITKPCLIHCNTGVKAALALFLYIAIKMKAPKTQVFLWGKDMGYNFASNAKLYEFINSYLPN